MTFFLNPRLTNLQYAEYIFLYVIQNNLYDEYSMQTILCQT